MNIKQIARNIGACANKNAPSILTGCSVAGLVLTTVFAIQATPKALLLIEEEKNRRETEANEYGTDHVEDITKLDIIKIAWKPYLSAASIGVVTIACIIGSNTINTKRNAALASAFALSETAFKEYKNKVIEGLGKNTHKELKEEIAQDKVNATPVNEKTVVITGNGDTLCLDLCSGRYFRSSVEKLKRAENEINKQLMNDVWVSQNEFYGAIGLEPISTGWGLGWDVNRDGFIDLDISTCLTDNDEPCITFDFGTMPKPQ